MAKSFSGSRKGRCARHGALGAKLIKKRKNWKSRNAVSEIIGNILILAITVIMFSGIFVFVASMDGPAEKVYTDFVGSVVIEEVGDEHYVKEIKIINKGGSPLEDHRTAIYLFVSDAASSLRISDGYKRDGVKWNSGDTWSTGSEWNYKGSDGSGLTNVNNKAKISVMIVDVQANTVVWEAMLQGSDDKSTAPIIGSRGISSTNSPVAGNIYVGDHVRFFAYISSPYGSINPETVKVDVSRLSGFNDKTSIDLSNDGSGVYWSDSLTQASMAWNGKVITFHAEGDDEQKVSANFQIKVLPGANSGGDNPLEEWTDTIIDGEYPSDASGGTNGAGNTRLGTTFYYIRNAATGAITREFSPGEKVLVEFYSNTIVNLAITNSFEVTNPITGEIMETQSSVTKAFSYIGIYSGFYRYSHTFNAPEDSLEYPIQIRLKDTYGTNLNVRDSISVGHADYPVIETYRLNGNVLEKTINFQHTDTLYLKIRTQDVDPDISTTMCGVVTISDLSGRYIINRAPPASDDGSPISPLFKTQGINPSEYTGQGGEYTIFIELKVADLGWWLPKKNSYMLSIDRFIDTGKTPSGELVGEGEIYHKLTTHITVTAPLSMTDIVASIGTGSYTWSSTGASWDDNKLVWYERGSGSDAWRMITIDESTFQGPLAMKIVDMDSDGINDLVVAFQDPLISIAWYRSNSVDGTLWDATPLRIAYSFDAYGDRNAVTDGYRSSGTGSRIFGSNNQGLANEDVSLYAPKGTKFVGTFWGLSFDYDFPGGFISGSDYIPDEMINEKEICVAMETGDFNGDGFMDVVASFAHVVIHTEARSYDDAMNHPEKSQAMFFNRGVYVYWGGMGWEETALEGTRDWASELTNAPKANSNDNPAILDLAVSDFNMDGCDDIVGVTETGNTTVWVSNWERSVNPNIPENSAFHIYPLPSMESRGTLPFLDHSQRMPRVEVADMNNDGYLDIVRSNTGDNTITIFYTKSSIESETKTYADKEYGMVDGKPTATTLGDLAVLRDDDGVMKTITEVYIESIPVSSSPKSTTDTDPDTIPLIVKEDDNPYVMYADDHVKFYNFAIAASDSHKTIASVLLHVVHAVDDYDGNGKISWSLGDVDFIDTNIQPGHSENQVYDLYAVGVDSVDDVQLLQIAFEHSGTKGQVDIDAIWLEIKFVEGRHLEWQFEIDNRPGLPIHTLEIEAKCSTDDEQYVVMYSPNGLNWFDLGIIKGYTDATYSFPIHYTSSAKYYVKLVGGQHMGLDQTVRQSIFLDYLWITHYSPSVKWEDDSKTSGSIPTNSGDYITAIAIGDMNADGATAQSGSNEIVVATSSVGASGKTLFIVTHSGGTFATKEVQTPKLNAAVGNGNRYDVASIALGDFDADGDLDIVLVIGFAPGASGASTIPTIWIYSNNPYADGWTFEEAPLSALGGNEAGINVVTGNINLSLFFPFIGLAGIVVASISIERMAKRKR